MVYDPAYDAIIFYGGAYMFQSSYVVTSNKSVGYF